MNPSVETPAARERDLNSLYVLAVMVVLIIVTMTFGALIVAFYFRSQVALNWNHIVLPPVLWFSTAVLLVSSAVSEVARRRLRAGDQRGFFRLACVTTALSALFLTGQLTAWVQILKTGVLLDKNPHPSFVFLFSGLHGAHILAGIAGWVWLLMRTRVPASGRKYQMNTRVVANAVTIFWHYLDLLWIVLFVLLLTWRR